MIKKLILLTIPMVIAACSSGGKQAAREDVPTYKCVKIDTADAVIHTDFAAEIKGEVVVDIRPRVSGYVDQICITEGSKVSKGQPLFIIDQNELQQQYNAAVANVDGGKASVAKAELEVRKLTPLVEKGIISQFELENAESNLRAALANLKYVVSQMNNAKINLSYATMTSPVDGVVGRIIVRQGSLVSPSGADPLTTVSGDDMVSAYFSLDEQSMLALSESIKGASLKEKIEKLPNVNLIMANGMPYEYQGKMELASGLVDMTTGAMQVKANFKNPNGLLRSGSSGIVRVNNYVNRAILVPQKATYQMQDRTMVYLLQDSATLKSVAIEVEGLSGENYVVSRGVKRGDVILLEGLDFVREGEKIKPEILEAKIVR